MIKEEQEILKDLYEVLQKELKQQPLRPQNISAISGAIKAIRG